MWDFTSERKFAKNYKIQYSCGFAASEKLKSAEKNKRDRGDFPASRRTDIYRECYLSITLIQIPR